MIDTDEKKFIDVTGKTSILCPKCHVYYYKGKTHPCKKLQVDMAKRDATTKELNRIFRKIRWGGV